MVRQMQKRKKDTYVRRPNTSFSGFLDSSLTRLVDASNAMTKSCIKVLFFGHVRDIWVVQKAMSILLRSASKMSDVMLMLSIAQIKSAGK